MHNKLVYIVLPLIFFISISDALDGLKTRSVDDDLEICIPGSRWAEDCNRCMCTDNGRTVCTNWPCQPYQPDNIYRNWDRRICHLGEVWKQECNVCICIGFGRVSCTSHDCDRETGSINNLERKMERKRRETVEKETRPTTDGTGKLCTSGEQWKEGCAECECVLGMTVCNAAPCLPKEESSEEVEIDRKKREVTITVNNATGKLCNPGNKWKEGCKNCICGDYGMVLCTLEECQQQQQQQESSEEVEIDRKKRGVTVTVNNATGNMCNPGNKWKEGCKNCVCGDYGMVLCTLEECQQQQQQQESSEEVEIDRKKREVTVTVNNATGKLCNPGNKWKEGCKNCICGDYGMVLCTLEECQQQQQQQESSEEVEIDRKKREVDNKSEPKRCTPGTTWMEDCNTCVCAGNGLKGCTLMACPPKLNDQTQRQKRDDGKCTPGTTWKDDCNTCSCSPDGTPLCTLMYCHHTKRETIQRPAKCTPGSSWQEDCNRCFCSADGTPGCTLKACLSQTIPQPNQRRKRQLAPAKCTPGSSWQEDCNRCFCSADGTPGCTLKACLSQTIPQPNQRRKRQLVQRPAKCTPGSSWQEDCNRCICAADGTPGCTLKACLSQTIPQPNQRRKRQLVEKCVPGTSWKLDCNTCTCSEYGVPGCTLMGCSSETFKNPNQRSKRDSDQCVPGTTWQEDCNTCFCQNGLKACTRRGCSSGTINLPQTQKQDEQCTPGSTWQEDCNTCWCPNGLKACTRRGCPSPDMQINVGDQRTKRELVLADDSAKQDQLDQSISELEKNCEIGKTYAVSCNVCQCGEVGLICTKRLCIGPELDLEISEI